MSRVEQAAWWARGTLAVAVALNWTVAALMTCVTGIVVSSVTIPASEAAPAAGLFLALLAVRTVPATALAGIGLLCVPRFQHEPTSAFAGVVASTTLAAPVTGAMGACLTFPFLSMVTVVEVPVHLVLIAAGLAGCAQVLRAAADVVAEEE